MSRDDVTRATNRITSYAESDAFMSLDLNIRMAIIGGMLALISDIEYAEAHDWPPESLTAWLAKANQFIAEHKIP